MAKLAVRLQVQLGEGHQQQLLGTALLSKATSLRCQEAQATPPTPTLQLHGTTYCDSTTPSQATTAGVMSITESTTPATPNAVAPPVAAAPQAAGARATERQAGGTHLLLLPWEVLAWEQVGGPLAWLAGCCDDA
jgi:hypothetical protein